MSQRNYLKPEEISGRVRQYVDFDDQVVLNHHLHAAVECPICEERRYVKVSITRYQSETFTAVCGKCNSPSGKPSVLLTTEEIREEIRRYVHLGQQEFRKYSTKGKPHKHNALYVLVTCKKCGADRWVLCATIRHRPDTFTTLCRNCSNSGPDNPRWRGGRRISAGQGYVRVRVFSTDQHYDLIEPMIRADNTILEHRLVMALQMGRPLEKWEHVHHINGNKSDNRKENLLLVLPKEHQNITDMQQEIKRLRLENEQLKERIVKLESH